MKSRKISDAVDEMRNQERFEHISHEKELAEERKRLADLVIEQIKQGKSIKEAVKIVYEGNKKSEVLAKEKTVNPELSLENWVKGFYKNFFIEENGMEH